MCWQWIILLLADALEILRTANMTPAPTHFRDPPSEVSQLQKVGLHPLDSLSGKHSQGFFFSAFPTPSIIDPFCGLRILLGFFMMKEKVITVRHLSMLVCVHGCRRQSFFTTKKKKALTYQRQISASCLFLWSLPRLSVSRSAARVQKHSPGQVSGFRSFLSEQANKQQSTKTHTGTHILVQPRTSLWQWPAEDVLCQTQELNKSIKAPVGMELGAWGCLRDLLKKRSLHLSFNGSRWIFIPWAYPLAFWKLVVSGNFSFCLSNTWHLSILSDAP